jgi:hypothetical protein
MFSYKKIYDWFRLLFGYEKGLMFLNKKKVCYFFSFLYERNETKNHDETNRKTSILVNGLNYDNG